MTKSAKELFEIKKKREHRAKKKSRKEYRMYRVCSRNRERERERTSSMSMKHMKRQWLGYCSYLVVDQNERVVVVEGDLYEHYRVYSVRRYHIVQ